jgi:tape measure domain-containing protein
MVDAEKMMLGFNIQAEDTVRYLQALSDISMGDSVKFKSLTLAFSQMSAAGKLMGQDLNQMINAGFNPLQIIAEKTGKSISTLKDEMSKGAVSAEMVQQAFIDATSAGGKFYQMSENASKTINGQLSMMQDALDNAFNEMGQASEGVIMEGIQLTTTLIQNYETVGKALVQADKDFKELWYTNRNHGISGGNTRNHLLRQITNWFKDKMK